MKKRVIFTAIVSLTLVCMLGVMARPRAKETGKAPAAIEANVSWTGTQPVSAGPTQVERNAEREAYFGETHIHTSWSFDAYIYGNTKAGPEDAYKYALGQTITHLGATK